MSQMRPLIDGWVGYGDGASILLRSDEPVDANHPVAKERPELFEAIDPPTVPSAKPVEPPAKKAATKKAARSAADG